MDNIEFPVYEHSKRVYDKTNITSFPEVKVSQVPEELIANMGIVNVLVEHIKNNPTDTFWKILMDVGIIQYTAGLTIDKYSTKSSELLKRITKS